jgi:hypothetical protein
MDINFCSHCGDTLKPNTVCCESEPRTVEDARREARAVEEAVEHGWPGDGSGIDDLADYNANEVNDYMGE